MYMGKVYKGRKDMGGIGEIYMKNDIETYVIWILLAIMIITAGIAIACIVFGDANTDISSYDEVIYEENGWEYHLIVCDTDMRERALAYVLQNNGEIVHESTKQSHARIVWRLPLDVERYISTYGDMDSVI